MKYKENRQTNTKMLFVKTKQETIWWFLLPGLVVMADWPVFGTV